MKITVFPIAAKTLMQRCFVLLIVLTLLAPAQAQAQGQIRTEPVARGAWLGDAGHYLTGGTRMHLLNPDGRAFSVTVHRYNWPFEGGWNQRKLPLILTGPDGQTVIQTTVETDEEGASVSVPAGTPGVYTLTVKSHSLNYWHVRTSLPKAVVWTGPGTGNASPYAAGGWLTVSPQVPRTWHFYVPKGTPYFTVRTQSHSARTQREDHGLIVRSPRGQPMAALWDQPDPSVKDGTIIGGRERELVDEAHIVVDPGSDGRFWSLEVRLGGGHLWSDFPVALLGVPPYLAQAPELWFDAATGLPAPIEPYDDSPYVRTDMPEESERERPYLTYWMPAPALGDPAANELRTPARIALQNPEGRSLRLVLSTYLPRGMRDVAGRARLEVAGPAILFDEDVRIGPDESAPWQRTVSFKGTGQLSVTGLERFWMYSYPAVPTVLTGETTTDDSVRFLLESGGLRHWYFKVPTGTQSFAISFETEGPADVLALDVHAPDRLMGRLYGRSGKTRIEVPPGLDGMIWHLAIEPGGASRYIPTGAQPRYALLRFVLALEGGPQYLAPTWEQWFLPDL